MYVALTHLLQITGQKCNSDVSSGKKAINNITIKHKLERPEIFSYFVKYKIMSKKSLSYNFRFFFRRSEHSNWMMSFLVPYWHGGIKHPKKGVGKGDRSSVEFIIRFPQTTTSQKQEGQRANLGHAFLPSSCCRLL